MVTNDEQPHRLDDETIALGRANLDRLRRQLHKPPPPDKPQAAEPDATTPEEMTADRIAAEMTAGALRDTLIARIEQLEAEVTQLRSALAAVLEAASAGLRPPDIDLSAYVGESTSGDANAAKSPTTGHGGNRFHGSESH